MLLKFIKMMPVSKMLRSRKLILITVALIFLCGFEVAASPMVIKGADGSWLPVIASSWSEKGGGVIVKTVEGVDLVSLRKNLTDIFPDITIEIINKSLFFPSTNIDDLFETIKNVDIGISVKAFSFSKESLEKPVIKKVEQAPLPKDELIEAVVHSVLFSAEEGKLVIDVIIKKRSKSGDFTRLNGKQKIIVMFKMKDGAADSEDEKNRYFGTLILIKKGNIISFIPEKIESHRTISISSFLISPDN
jgi:hypothetical protein